MDARSLANVLELSDMRTVSLSPSGADTTIWPVRLSSERLDARNVEHCRKLWGDRPLYSGLELDRILATTSDLLREGRARGALLLDDGVPRYFGLTVFVDPATGTTLMTEPRPRIGHRLLEEPCLSSILTEEAIGRGNARDGLHMVVINQGWNFSDLVGDPWPTVLGSVFKEVEEVHAGFRLAAIIGEVFGEGGAVLRASRAFPNMREFTASTPRGTLSSLLFWMTRREAETGYSLLLPMFSYAAPRVSFTRHEQRLLRHALSGATDAELGLRLSASVTSVKSLWRRVFERVTTELGRGLLTDDGEGSGTRGNQKRHLVLEYVRRHPEELTPFDRRSQPCDPSEKRERTRTNEDAPGEPMRGLHDLDRP